MRRFAITRRHALVAAALLAAGPALGQTTLERGQGGRLHPRRLRQRGALRLRHAGRQAHRRGARGGQGGARQDGHRAGRRRAHRVRLADPGPARPAASTSSPRACSSTPQRCEQIAFSEPTYGIGQAMLVPEGNPKGIADYRASPTTPTSSSRSWPAPSRPATPGCRRRPGPAGDAARPVEPGRRRPGRPRRRRGADRALDRRHGPQGRGRRDRPSRSARSPASR